MPHRRLCLATAHGTAGPPTQEGGGPHAHRSVTRLPPPMSGGPQVRKIIAKRLLESKLTSPSLYVSADAELDGVMTLRKTLAEAGNKVRGARGDLDGCGADAVRGGAGRAS